MKTSLADLIAHATNKDKFQTVGDYIDFCARYLEYIDANLQARIVSQNESHYLFLQYKEEGYFNITRPLNSRLMYDGEFFDAAARGFSSIFVALRAGQPPSDALRENMIRMTYTLQQAIGATLDALPSGKSNQARKLNGDLFERLVRLMVVSLGVDCVSGTMQVPVRDENGTEIFKSVYQHDLLLKRDGELKIIGSVKTSSKDRIDKVFMDKFLYGRLTDTALPHIAIFLNDVQRKRTKREDEYGINGTFLSGHFKAYTVKLNPLDGVYYCDVRPNMLEDALLSRHIRTIDHFFYSDLWELLARQGQTLGEVCIKEAKGDED
jgi:hypothetical protein